MKLHINIILLFIIIFINSCSVNIANVSYEYDVTIYRDTWGVPHIYGKTDEDVAYGLAYAHAEDDFKTIQNVLIALRAKLGSVYGREAAPSDYLVNLLKIWEIVDDQYEKNLSPKIRSICDAYADGLNKYISKHPEELIADIYPAKGKDIIAGFVYRTPLMFGLDRYLKKLYEEEKPNFTEKLDKNKALAPMFGSNVIAVGPNRSEDGFTRIAINTHQPWEGPVTWYEVHLHSEEGWNISGGLFPGSPILFIGHNQHIGWSHTVNQPDLVDIYELIINPKNDNQYLLDGNWEEFENGVAPIKVKIWGPFKWTFNRDLFWSKHGPVIKTDHGVYAIRFSANDKIGQIDQWYKMNKAKNLSEFKDAMGMMQIPMFNTAYADAKGNLYYLYNALIPKRKTGYNWDGILPGDRSDLIWNTYYDISELPQVTNPKSAFIQNCNSTPYLASMGKDNPQEILSDDSGIEKFQTNRALRAIELYGNDDSITKDEFINYKYDTYYSDSSVMSYARKMFLDHINTQDSLLNIGVELIKNWDLGNQKENRSASIAHLTFKPTYNIKNYTYNHNQVLDRFKNGVQFLLKEFGYIDVPLGMLQRIQRGNIDLPLDGAPDVLRAIYSKMTNNRKVAFNGDCFFQIVEWDTEGKIHSKSIHQYGSGTLDTSSIHFSDQSYLFSQKKMKTVWMDLDSIKNNLERSYIP